MEKYSGQFCERALPTIDYKLRLLMTFAINWASNLITQYNEIHAITCIHC